ncbi:MAG: hypothetical protein IKZ88_09820 [Neisseriaceae bacterium]|nr:hypothetical protein [Neisseriaceae bacterium]
MAKNKFSVDFSGFEQYQRKLEQLAGGEAVKDTLNTALKETQSIIAGKVDAAMSSHNDTGRLQKTIIKSDPPEWSAGVGAVNVGFDITAGGSYDGLPSIFLMYGTQLYGQPHIKPDKNLYNAVYGTATKRQVQDVQKKAFEDAITGVMK